MPKTARATSLRPAPTSPASATTSPARTSKEMSTNTPSRVRRSTLSTTSPGSCAWWVPLCTSRPTMARTRSSGVSPSSGRETISLPSRSTVTRWQMRKTSSSRWEMKTTAAPSARSVSTTVNRRSASTGDSAAVGSSMIRTRASRVSALAISTSCCSAIDRPRAMRSGSIATPRRLKISSTWRSIARASMRRPLRSGWRPMNTFSATDRSGNSVGSW